MSNNDSRYDSYTPHSMAHYRNDNETTVETPMRRRKESEATDHRIRRHNGPTPPNKNNHKRKKIFRILLTVVLVIFYAAGIYLYHAISDVQNTLDNTFTATDLKKLRNVSAVLKQGKPISILLLGTDTGDLGRTDKGRTDTMMIATINPQSKRVTLTSIPRDLKVKINDSGEPYSKINSAYTFSGVSGAVDTVQDTLHIPIDYYILVNMGGLKKLVNAVGGVTITPLLTFKYEDADVVEGKTVHMNGKQALAYARMRYDDPRGDYGRQDRQRQVIRAIVKKGTKLTTLSTQYDDILETMEKNMQTDLSYDDILTLISKYKSAAGEIKSYTLHGQDTYLGGVSYQVATAKEKERISKLIRKELGLKPSKKSFRDESYSSYNRDNYNNNYGYDNSYDYGYGY
ncbi:LCP family protein [Ligilactobacillus equi]|uniref:LCP family protein n=1 Tax=Ligilactobacillus equi TaxID=137357 RepID=UPI002ED00037